MRLIQASFPQRRLVAVRKAVEEAEPADLRVFPADEDGQCRIDVFYAQGDVQGVVDRLQTLLDGERNWRVIVLPVEATLPAPTSAAEESARRSQAALREEIYEDVRRGTTLSWDFFLLTVASTLVAALGMNANNVAAVIGAMVIAPLLGPILAVSFATALGDVRLLVQSSRSALAGLLTGLATAVVLGAVMPLNLESPELLGRTLVGLDSFALALAAGVAAALSVTAGVPSGLVGVMVAVALLPPAAAAGLFLGHGAPVLAGRAGLLLTVNVIGLMLAAQAVYAVKGVRPRRWVARTSAAGAVRANLAILTVLLALAGLLIVTTPSDVLPAVPDTP